MKNASFRLLTLALVSGGLFATSAQAYIVNFNEYSAGRIIDTDYATGGQGNTASTLPTGQGFTVSVNANNHRPNIGVLYDTNKTGGWDSDLEGGSNGNLFVAGNQKGVAQGNALIIQNSATSREIRDGKLKYSSGKFSGSGGNSPNDSAFGGSITFSFESSLVAFGFNFVDLDNNEFANISFIDSLSGATATVNFGQFVNPSSDLFRSGVKFGDSTANQISPITIANLNSASSVKWSGGSAPGSFDQVRFTLNGSGGVSSINFTPVPEPGTVAAGFALLSLAGFGIYRRRNTKSDS